MKFQLGSSKKDFECQTDLLDLRVKPYYGFYQSAG